MAIKHVVGVGCSHVFGSDLPDVKYPFASPSAWPNLVATELGATCANISKIAGGNGAIYRRTLVYLQSILSKYQSDEILLLVQFSHQDRHELIHNGFQWCGDDFPYVTSKFQGEPLIDKKTNRLLLDTIKTWNVAADDSYRLLSSLQSKLLLLLTAEQLNIKTFWGEADRCRDIVIPEYGVLSDTNIGISEWNKVHTEYAKTTFEVAPVANLNCYKLKQSGTVFDTFTLAIDQMISNTSAIRLYYEEFDNWLEWCKARDFSFLMQLWEQGDNNNRPLEKIPMHTKTNVRLGNGHYGLDAHKRFSELVLDQIKENS